MGWIPLCIFPRLLVRPPFPSGKSIYLSIYLLSIYLSIYLSNLAYQSAMSEHKVTMHLKSNWKFDNWCHLIKRFISRTMQKPFVRNKPIIDYVQAPLAGHSDTAELVFALLVKRHIRWSPSAPPPLCACGRWFWMRRSDGWCCEDTWDYCTAKWWCVRQWD